ncbi:efflux RND transporter periplasmic adaptor subunit [Glaciecola sp. MF2-115]|uniref:efflux RND transporter periplasmic adaptor subunit n=1 Tax=Glaciecola sp. MF2-115 TaxID=3384827 RepID=UPI0039A2B6C5
MKFLQSVVSTLTILFTLSACSGSEENKNGMDSSKSEPAKKVWTTPLSKASEGIKRHLTGTIQAADAVSVSFEVSGVISKMHVDLGQAFKKGDVLAELDTALYSLDVQKSESALGEANAALLDAKQTHERNNKLRQQGLISQAALDTSTANYDIAKQRFKVAESALNIAKKNLSDTQLIAPYSGRVSARLVEPSQQIQAGTSVLSIQGNANLEVSAAIPEGLIGKVTLLDQVDVVVPSLSASKTYAATLTEIGAQASIANAFPITITFNEHFSGFYPGMSAEIILMVSSLFDGEEYFEIPFSAFTTDNSGPYLYFVAQQENKQNAIAKKYYIDIVELKPESAIIRFKQEPSSLTTKPSRIVKTGLDFIRPDQAISVVETTTIIYNQ